jgi:hypothetical protein
MKRNYAKVVVMAMWTVELTGVDAEDRALPRNVGPFDTRQDGERFLEDLRPWVGSADFSRLVPPTLALSLAHAPFDDDVPEPRSS